MTPSISLEVIKRAFSTEAVELTKDSDSQASGERQLAKTLNSEELMKLDFYSKFTPTSVTLSHFLDHSSGGGTVEDSFLFLRREIPVRLANMMMELEVRVFTSPSIVMFLFLHIQLLPSALHDQPACQEIIAQYGQSFQDILQFENSSNTPETHKEFNDVITNIRLRHQVLLTLSFLSCYN